MSNRISNIESNIEFACNCKQCVIAVFSEETTRRRGGRSLQYTAAGHVGTDRAGRNVTPGAGQLSTARREAITLRGLTLIDDRLTFCRRL